MTEEQKAILTAKREEQQASARQWIASRFGVSPETVRWFNAGSSYDRVIVTTRESAERISRAASKDTANGGYFHGMQLGRITECADGTFDVMC